MSTDSPNDAQETSEVEKDDENELPSHHSSKENVQTSNNKTAKRSVTSRLYQSTAASAAKVSKPTTTGSGLGGATSRNTTPVLARKNYSKGNTTPVNKPPVWNMCRSNLPKSSEIKSKLGQKPKLGEKRSEKRVATSSFIHQEISPADWDASAIVPIDERGNTTPASAEKKASPELDDNPKKMLKGLFSFEPRKISKISKNVSSEGARSGPLKAILPTGQRPTALKAETSEKTICRSIEIPKIRALKSSQNSSHGESSSEDPSEDLERLFDDYLLSELVRQNSKKSFEQNSDKMDAEVTAAWMGLEELRCRVIEKEKLNRKLKKMIELSNSLDGEISVFRPFVDSDNLSAKNLIELSTSLEHSRHHLQVIGANISTGDSSTGEQLRKKIESNIPTFEGSTRSLESEAMTALQKNMATALTGFEDCKSGAEKVRNLSLECASLRLSQQQMKERSDKFRDFLKVPKMPEVKLVDF